VGDTTWVAEVKSITAQNETRQLRHGLGQVLHYRHLLAAEGREVQAMLVTERQWAEPSWAELLDREGRRAASTSLNDAQRVRA
jgi:hypothetical protein